MTKKSRYQAYVLGGLVAVLAFALYNFYSRTDSLTGVQVSADGQFEPLNVPDPSLRLDLLDQIQKEQYTGQHRNIFSAEPPPPPPDVVAAQQKAAEAAMGPALPPPPPPLTVPATFYGIVTNSATGRKQACFSGSQDVIYIVPEGGTLLNQFRVTKIGNNTVDVQEISSGRSTTLTLPQGGQQPNMPEPPQEGER
jgi:hypothetical protein